MSIGQDLLEDVEVAHRVVAAGTTPWRRKKRFCCSSFGQTKASRDGLGTFATSVKAACATPLASRHWTPMAPSRKLALPPRWTLRVVLRFALVGEHVAGVVQDDVEDDVEPLRVRGVDQGAQLVVGVRRVVGEPGLGRDEIVDAVTVIRRVGRANSRARGSTRWPRAQSS